MAAPLSVSSQVRDIQIDMKDSCNCCCLRKIKPSTPVYVHEDGRVEAFRSRKSDNITLAQIRSHENLTQIIGEMARHRLIELSTVWEESAKRGVVFSREMPIMMQTVRDLVAIIEESHPAK